MLSLILYGRNDSYGYNLHKRAAISLNCMAEMLTAPDDEIIFVDYNTPDDFPTFPEAIQDTLTERAKSLLRILRVRPSQHERFRKLSHLVALEPISRNIAVRRSNPANRWILSTNTDMVFVPRRRSTLSEVAATLPDSYYGLPRFEVPETLWESADRLDPTATIEAFGRWGSQYHLNEIVFSQDPAVRFDAPGDFQLILRSDLWRIHGFNEQMLLGWHVDSNMAKRLALIPYQIGDLVDDFFGYHCDHTRQVTPMHRSRAAENSLQEFFEDVIHPEVPKQSESWGLAGETIEELRIGSTSRVYLEALKSAPDAALTAPYEIHYSGRSYNHTDYAVEHVTPFLVDIFASYPRTTVVGWVGSKRSLLERFSQALTIMGFPNPILVLEAAQWLGPRLPEGSVWTNTSEFEERCDVFVFDWGRPDGRSEREWRFDSDGVTTSITRAFRHMVKAERLRNADLTAHPRRFIGVNAINNSIERLIGDHVGVTRSPLATRVRQGFVTEHRETQDLMPHLLAGDAARKLSGKIVARPGAVGLVFAGPYVDLEPAAYRLTIRVDYKRSNELPLTDSGVTLELVAGPWLLSYGEITSEELENGTITREFRVLPNHDGAQPPRFEMRLRTAGWADLSVAAADLEETQTSALSTDQDANLGEINYIELLHLGPAGIPVASASGKHRFAIHANPGVPNYICYGPYFWLPSGQYEATFEFNVHGAAFGSTISIYIVAEQGRTLFGKGSFVPNKRGAVNVTVAFAVGADMPSGEDGLLEFLVWTNGESVFSMTGVRINANSDVPRSGTNRTAPAPGLLATCHTIDAGTRLPDGIITLTRVSGYAFTGPLEVATGTHRLTLDVDRCHFVPTPTNESGIALVVAKGALVVGYREITRAEIESGEFSIDFYVSDEQLVGASNVEFRLWTTGLAEIVIAAAYLEAAPAEIQVGRSFEFDATLLLGVGQAGERVIAPVAPSRMAIHARPGVEGNVSNGPYVWLEPGRYGATFELLVERGISKAEIVADVVTNLGGNVIAEGSIRPKRRGLLKRTMGKRWSRVEGSLEFDVPEKVPAGDNGRLEFRTWSSGAFEFFVIGLHVKRLQGSLLEVR